MDTLIWRTAQSGVAPPSVRSARSWLRACLPEQADFAARQGIAGLAAAVAQVFTKRLQRRWCELGGESHCADGHQGGAMLVEYGRRHRGNSLDVVPFVQRVADLAHFLDVAHIGFETGPIFPAQAADTRPQFGGAERA